MATLGLLSPEFPSVSLSANLDAIAATGAVSVQFDLASAVGRTFPTELSQDIVEAIGARFAELGKPPLHKPGGMRIKNRQPFYLR